VRCRKNAADVVEGEYADMTMTLTATSESNRNRVDCSWKRSTSSNRRYDVSDVLVFHRSRYDSKMSGISKLGVGLFQHAVCDITAYLSQKRMDCSSSKRENPTE
jgi:hypothetical protein